MSYKTESYNSLISDESPSCEVWVMTRPDFNTMNCGINQIVQEYHVMMDCIENIQIDKDKLELLRAKAWAFDGGSPNYVWQSKDQLLASYRDRKVK